MDEAAAAPAEAPQIETSEAPVEETSAQPSAALPDVFDAENLGELAERKVRLKVNGEVVEVPLSKALEHARLGTAAFRKFDEAKALRDEAAKREQGLRAALQMAKERPLDFVRRFGPDAEERLLSAIHAEMQREALPPEERRGLDLEERERAIAERERRYQEEQEKRSAAEREAQIEQQAQAYQQHLGQVFTKALTEAGLTEAELPEGVQRMAGLARRVLRAGVQIDPAELARVVSGEMEQQFSARASKLAPEVLHKRLGTKMADLRKLELAQLQSAQRPANENGRGAAPTRRAPDKAPIVSDQMSSREWTEYLNRRMREG